ncbi:T9SS type A sorting domain-containing protein [Spirosoma sp. KNUC1025]|uniref:T9SS type A sorting domain-containing protein n=1 Tax=Spirosoma sp. KNUC1025 TaxID=2894082 RepID=UPI00386A86D4|nr:T9SS type A sorting domain-containing protein [Spirosoma sp. KNUC1025]
MRTAIYKFRNVALVLLIMLGQVANAQTTDTNSGDPLTKEASFEVGSYMGDNWTINLMLAIRQPQGATVMIRDANKKVLYEQHLKKSPIVYHHKLRFEDCKSGIYYVEISDGKQTVVRRVEVVEMPSIETQRYITYGPQSGQ